MAVKIRLKRMGKIRAPFYRVVVMDSRTKRDGRAIEEIGKYHPTEQPSLIEIDSERAQYWLSVGAQPTEAGRGAAQGDRRLAEAQGPAGRRGHPAGAPSPRRTSGRCTKRPSPISVAGLPQRAGRKPRRVLAKRARQDRLRQRRTALPPELETQPHCHWEFTPACGGRPALDETAALPTSSWPAEAGHPRLVAHEQKSEPRKTWMAGPSPAMTTGSKPRFLVSSTPALGRPALHETCGRPTGVRPPTSVLFLSRSGATLGL